MVVGCDLLGNFINMNKLKVLSTIVNIPVPDLKFIAKKMKENREDIERKDALMERVKLIREGHAAVNADGQIVDVRINPKSTPYPYGCNS